MFAMLSRLEFCNFGPVFVIGDPENFDTHIFAL